MKVKRITNERENITIYNVTYSGKSRVGNNYTKTFQGNFKLPASVLECVLNGECVLTRYTSDGAKVEIFQN